MPCECEEHSCFCFNVCRCRKETCECELCTEIRLQSCNICQRPAFLEGRFAFPHHFKEYCCCFIGESEVLPHETAPSPPQQDLHDQQDPIKVGGWPPLVIVSYEDPEHTEHELTTALKDCAIEESDLDVEKNATLKVSDSDRDASQETESYFQQTLMTKSQKVTEQNLENKLTQTLKIQMQGPSDEDPGDAKESEQGPSDEDPGDAKESEQGPSEEDPGDAKYSEQLPSEEDSRDATVSVPLQSYLRSDKTSSESTKFKKRSD